MIKDRAGNDVLNKRTHMKHIKSLSEHQQASCPIAIIVSQFNQSITDALLAGALQQLKHHHVHQDDITLVEVPGAIEIPLIAKVLAKKNQYATDSESTRKEH